MLRFFLLSLIFFVFTLRATSQRIEGQLIVEWEDNTSSAAALEAWGQQRVGLEVMQEEKLYTHSFSISLIQISPPPPEPEDWIHTFRQIPGVKAAQWDYKLEFNAIPDDPYFGDQWAPAHIGADRAWDQTTGGLTTFGDTIVVAVLDGGFDTNHPDLSQNTWTNPGEIPNDGLDNDKNGLVDDYRGWNFITNSPEHFNDSHGTSVAGIIGAKGNNGIGVAGINWDIKMMLLSTEKVSDVIEAYSYVIQQRERYHSSKRETGAFVVATNASFGLSEVFCDQQPIWGAMYDHLGNAGILTAAAVVNSPVNVDEVGDMPTSCPSPFLITVLSSTENSEKESISGFGPLSVDLAAPGVSIRTTKPNSQYGYFSGTSAAAPHVSGAIALLYSTSCLDFGTSAYLSPQQTALAVKGAILRGTTPSPNFEGLTFTGGRLSIDKSMDLLIEQCNLEAQNNLEIKDIYPNPALEGITVNYRANDQKRISWRMLNFLGQVVAESALPVSPWTEKQFYLPLSHLPNGFYILMLTDGQVQVSKAFFLG